MIQFLTFWSHSWRSRIAIERVTFPPSQKGYKELPVRFFHCSNVLCQLVGAQPLTNFSFTRENDNLLPICSSRSAQPICQIKNSSLPVKANTASFPASFIWPATGLLIKTQTPIKPYRPRWSRETKRKYTLEGESPTSYNRCCNSYKWPYKQVTGVITLIIGVITPFITGGGPTLSKCKDYPFGI